jgi:hypothetical protein
MPSEREHREGACGVATEEMDVALDRTVASLGGGVRRLGAEAALPVVAGWRERLTASGSPEFAPLVETLDDLGRQLSAGIFDPVTVGSLLMTLGEQVRAVAGEEVGAQVTGNLSRLGALLGSEGDSLSDYGKS